MDLTAVAQVAATITLALLTWIILFERRLSRSEQEIKDVRTSLDLLRTAILALSAQRNNP